MYKRFYAAKISDQSFRRIIAWKICARPATENGRAHSLIHCLGRGAQIQVYGQAGILVN
jgi:hypothetical protein